MLDKQIPETKPNHAVCKPLDLLNLPVAFPLRLCGAYQHNRCPQNPRNEGVHPLPRVGSSILGLTTRLTPNARHCPTTPFVWRTYVA